MHCTILQPSPYKTDSARRPKILLPGSWNWVESTNEGTEEGGHFPIQLSSSSELKSGASMDLRGEASLRVQVSVNK